MSFRPGGSSSPALRGPVRWEWTSKAGGGRRALVRPDRRDDLGYAAAVARVASFVQRAVPDESRAPRITGWDRRTGIVFEPWTGVRRRWRREVGRLLSTCDVVVITDARDCYGSIPPALVVEELRRSGACEDAAADVGAWLAAFADAGVTGLPVGPAASATLAEAVLSRGDLALRRPGIAHVRWVDDVAIFAEGRRTAVRALDALRREWARCGLEAHEGKSILVDPAEAAARLVSAGSGPGGGSTLR